MRMWLVNPKDMCRNHLLGEHSEIHRAVGNLNHSGTWARALIAKGFLEPCSFSARHKALADEMVRRGYNHQSPLDTKGFEKLDGKVNVKRSIKDLRERCKKCRV